MSYDLCSNLNAKEKLELYDNMPKYDHSKQIHVYKTVCHRKFGSGQYIRPFFSDPVLVRFRPNTDRIDWIWLSQTMNA